MKIEDLTNKNIPLANRLEMVAYFNEQSKLEIDRLWYESNERRRNKLIEIQREKTKQLNIMKEEIKKLEDEYYSLC
jgi:hypothetical protein